jgi:uncharacterized membrane protein
MDGIPSMWRTELWHPLLVHFPIALLLAGTALRLIGAFRGCYISLQFLVPFGRLLLLLGTIGAWAAVYTGSLADAEVVRSLCDPTVVEAHENWAYWVAGLFTGGLLVDALLWADLSALGLRGGLTILLMGCLLAGSAGLVYVGHLGSRLVYQQGAAVHHPAPDCAAFE